MFFCLLENGKIRVNGNGVSVNGNETKQGASQNPSFEMNGGYINAQEFSVGVYGKKAVFTLNDGVLESNDNAVVANNGTLNDTEDKGGTEINIKGGNLIGHITTAGYVANGIYQANYGSLNIFGGTIYAPGPGILARAGQINITGGKIISEGTNSGWVGDKK